MIKNVLANIVGRAGGALLNIITVPIFVKLLGEESFGLIAFMATFQSLVAFLDLGIAGTTTREIAASWGRGDFIGVRHLLRTMEYVYWFIAIIVFLFIAISSRIGAAEWVNAKSIPDEIIRQGILIFGIGMAVRWPVSLYASVLRGREAQICENSLSISASLGRACLGILSAWLFSGDLRMFVISQVVAGVMEVVVYYYYTWRSLNGSNGALFMFEKIAAHWRFALGFNLVGVFGMLVSASDRVILGRLADARAIAHYSIACTACGVLTMISNAVMVSAFPKIAMQFAGNMHEELGRFYQKLFSAMCILMGMLCMFGLVLGDDVFGLWLHNSNLVGEVSPIFLGLIFGFSANAISSVSYNFMVATARLKVPIFVNIASLPAVCILHFLLIPKFGATGAAVATSMMMVITLFIYAFFVWKYLGASKELLRANIYGGSWVFFGAAAVYLSAPHMHGSICKATLCIMILSWSAIGGVFFAKIEIPSIMTSCLRRLKF